jgi:uncharacterized integral membrane protein
MIRLIRYLLLVCLVIVLVTLAMSNRDIVTLRLMPTEAEAYIGFHWVVQVPLFLVIFAGMLLGLFIGFVWEWMREFRFRSTAKKATKQAANLERELGRLKEKTHGPKDEVLALLDKPRG